MSSVAAHGAEVTVTDISKPFPFADNSFDMIFNPISNCYIEDIMPMWGECARVIKSGGVLMMAFVKEEFIKELNNGYWYEYSQW